MMQLLLVAVGGGLELEGGMFDGDVEVLGHAFLQLGEDVMGLPVGEAFVLQGHVAGDDGGAGADEGGVEVWTSRTWGRASMC